MHQWFLVPSAFVLAWIALLTPSAPHHPARYGVSVEHQGVRLSLVLRARSYPRNSLVVATVQVKNTSRTTALRIVSCNLDNPLIQAVDRAGRIQSSLPTLLTGAPLPSCPPQLVPLRPGQTLQRHVVGIARSSFIRAVADLQAGGTGFQLVTPPLRISLTHQPSPHIVLHSNPLVSAIIARPSSTPHATKLFYVDWYTCSTSAGVQSGGHMLQWAVVSSNHIQPGCSKPLEWHVIAGWPNQPVVSINYVQPK